MEETSRARVTQGVRSLLAVESPLQRLRADHLQAICSTSRLRCKKPYLAIWTLLRATASQAPARSAAWPFPAIDSLIMPLTSCSAQAWRSLWLSAPPPVTPDTPDSRDTPDRTPPRPLPTPRDKWQSLQMAQAAQALGLGRCTFEHSHRQLQDPSPTDLSYHHFRCSFVCRSRELGYLMRQPAAGLTQLANSFAQYIADTIREEVPQGDATPVLLSLTIIHYRGRLTESELEVLEDLVIQVPETVCSEMGGNCDCDAYCWVRSSTSRQPLLWPAPYENLFHNSDRLAPTGLNA